MIYSIDTDYRSIMSLNLVDWVIYVRIPYTYVVVKTSTE